MECINRITPENIKSVSEDKVFVFEYSNLSGRHYCTYVSDAEIDEQVTTIKSATEKAMNSQETAIKFLVDAGIVDVDINSKLINKRKK